MKTMNTPALMLLSEVAEHTRTPISTVRQWVSSGKLVSVKPGRRRLVYRHDLERFLSAAQSKADSAGDERR